MMTKSVALFRFFVLPYVVCGRVHKVGVSENFVNQTVFARQGSRKRGTVLLSARSGSPLGLTVAVSRILQPPLAVRVQTRAICPPRVRRPRLPFRTAV